MSIADRIKEVIDSSGLTIYQFAEKVGDKPQRVKDVLRGKQRVPEDMLVSLVEIFHIDANWLLTGIRTQPVVQTQPFPEPTPEDPLVRQRALVKMLVDQVDEKTLAEVRANLEKTEQLNELRQRVVELERQIRRG